MKAVAVVGRLLLAAVLLVAGVAHFAATDEFLGQVPSFLPLREAIVIASGVSSYPYASTWWFRAKAHGDEPVARMSPTTDGWPLSISSLIRGHSRRSASTRGGSRRRSAARPPGGSGRNACRSR